MTFRTDYNGAVPRIVCHPYNLKMNGSIRQNEPAKMLRDQGLALTRVDPKEIPPSVLQTLNPDVIVLPSVYADERLGMMARYAKNAADAFIVYDIEDVLWDVPKHNPFYAECPKDMKKRLSKAFSIAHRITTTTETLADLVAKDFRLPRGKIRVVPNAISRTFLNAAQSVVKTANTGKLRVGWAGGASHSEDLKILTEVVKATADRYQWVFMGYQPEGTEGLVEFHPVVDHADYPRALAELNLDIAVAPLIDDKFNSGKSDLRILEFAACGYPVIASAVPAFSSAPVDIVKDSVEEWTKTLTLYESADVRAEAANYLHDWLLKDRMQDSPVIIEALLEAWLPVGSKNVRDSFNPELPASFARVPNGYLYTKPGTKVPEVPLQGIYNAGIASVSAVSNDGLYPTYGKFLALNDEAAETLPAASYTLIPEPVEIARITSPYVFLADNAIRAIGLPDFKRLGTPEAALFEWSVKATEAGFRHVLKPNVYAVATTEKANSHAMAYAAQQVMAWYPPSVIKAIEDKTNDLQAGVLASLAALDLAAYRLLPVNEGKFRILHINGVQESPVREGLIADGHSVLAASTLGHLLTLDPRYIIYVESIDLRREIDRLIETIEACRFDMIVLDGLHEGSPDAVLGAFGELARRGFNVQYLPNQQESVCPRLNMTQPSGPCSIQDKASQDGFNADRFCNLCVREHGSAYGLVIAGAYRATWRDFLEAAYKPVVNVDPTE